MSAEEKLHSINHLKNQVEAILPLKDWDQAFLEKVKIDFTHYSNKLEGNSLTYGQTLQLLKDLVTPRNAGTGEMLDIINHKKVLDLVFQNYRSQVLSEESICQLHAELMKDIAQWGDDGLYSPGKYKTFENVTYRSNGKAHTFLLPGNVANAMASLIVEVNQMLLHTDSGDIKRHPLVIATYFHQKFLNEIHPFADGNGRIGRIFMNLILLKKGYPPIFIKEVNRDEYLNRFEQSETDENAMLDFMADRLIESLQLRTEFAQNRTFPAVK